MAEERNGGESKEEGDDGRAVMTMVGRPTSAWSQAKKKRDVALIRHRKRSQLLQSTQSSRLVKDRRIAVVPTSSAPRPACLSIVAATETPSSAEKIGDREFFPFN